MSSLCVQTVSQWNWAASLLILSRQTAGACGRPLAVIMWISAELLVVRSLGNVVSYLWTNFPFAQRREKKIVPVWNCRQRVLWTIWRNHEFPWSYFYNLVFDFSVWISRWEKKKKHLKKHPNMNFMILDKKNKQTDFLLCKHQTEEIQFNSEASRWRSSVAWTVLRGGLTRRRGHINPHLRRH